MSAVSVVQPPLYSLQNCYVLYSFSKPLPLARFADQCLPMTRIVAVLRNPRIIRREAITLIKISYKEEGIPGLHSSCQGRKRAMGCWPDISTSTHLTTLTARLRWGLGSHLWTWTRVHRQPERLPWTGNFCSVVPPQGFIKCRPMEDEKKFIQVHKVHVNERRYKIRGRKSGGHPLRDRFFYGRNS